MKISIITVAFNSSSTIRDTIVSILNQTYQDIEYIIVDGLSKDNTIEIIKEFEPFFNGRMKWISEKDNGLYDAMNKGILLSTGDVIGILNSDDLFNSDVVIEKIMNVFENEKSIDAVYSDLVFVAKDDITLVTRKWLVGEKKSFKSGWNPAHPTFFVKRKIYEEYGLYNLKYNLAADFELMLRFLEKKNIRIHYLRMFIVRMRLGGASTRSLKNIIIQNKECIDAFKTNNIKINTIIYIFNRLIPKLFQFQYHEKKNK